MRAYYVVSIQILGVGPHQCSQEMGPQRIGRLRAYGNGLTAPQAAEFVKAFSEQRRNGKDEEEE